MWKVMRHFGARVYGIERLEVSDDEMLEAGEG